MSEAEKLAEVLETLDQVAEFRSQYILKSEMRATADRLVPFHGIELFRILRAIPGEAYFPTGFELENRVRKALGKEPLESISAGTPGPSLKDRFDELRKVTAKPVPAVEPMGSCSLTAEQIKNQYAAKPDLVGEFVDDMRERFNELLLGSFDDDEPDLDLGNF